MRHIPDARHHTLSHDSPRYIIELKYLGAKATEADKEKQWNDAVEQIHGYAKGRKVQLMCQGTELHPIIMQFKEHEMIRLEEV